MEVDGSLVGTHIDIVGICRQLEVGNDNGVLVGDEDTIDLVDGLCNLLDAYTEYIACKQARSRVLTLGSKQGLPFT